NVIKLNQVESCDVKKGKSLLSKRRRVYNVVSDDDDTVADDNKVYVADNVVNDKKKSIKRATKRKAIAGCDKVFSDVANAGNYVKPVDSTLKCDKVESCDVKKGKSLLSKRRRVYNVVSDDDDTVADDNKVYVADNVVNDKKKSIKRATKRKAIAGCDKVFSDVADAGNYVESGDVSYAAKKSKSLSSKGRRVLKGVSVDLTADDNKVAVGN
ncbi:hypothetical protein Tco_1550308, partial [Tanacetum coccineum]